jgi:hypothetical protein
MVLEIAYLNEPHSSKTANDFLRLYALVFDAPQTAAPLQMIQGRPNLLAGVAYCNGEPAGFKVGYSLPDAPDALYSWAGGTDPAFRRRGVAWALMVDQHCLAAEIGLEAVETKCRPKWAAMMALNYRAGFKLMREYRGESCGQLKYHLRKELAQMPAQSLPQIALGQPRSIVLPTPNA